MRESEQRKNLLSAVVPVTSIETRWPQIASWLEQTPDNTRIIFVHDSDNESERLKLKENLRNVVFDNYEIHEVNFKSPGMSRNFGLSKVKSEFVCFWDSDDLPIVENISNCITNFLPNIEIVVNQYETRFKGKYEKIVHSEDYKVEDLFVRSPGLWRMVFRTSILKDIQFPNLIMAEDQIFLLLLDLYSRNVFFSQNKIYQYIKGDPKQLTNETAALQTLPSAFKEVLSKTKSQRGMKVDLRNIVLFRLMLTSFKRFKILGIRKLISIGYLYICNDSHVLSKLKAPYLILRERVNL